MDMDFVRKRITELRMLNGKSEYQLSYDMGHSKNYIHNLVSGHFQPSVTELLYLIDLLGVTPRDFFDEDAEYRNPVLAKEIMDSIKDMDEEDLKAVLGVVRRLKGKETLPKQLFIPASWAQLPAVVEYRVSVIVQAQVNVVAMRIRINANLVSHLYNVLQIAQAETRVEIVVNRNVSDALGYLYIQLIQF